MPLAQRGNRGPRWGRAWRVQASEQDKTREVRGGRRRAAGRPWALQVGGATATVHIIGICHMTCVRTLHERVREWPCGVHTRSAALTEGGLVLAHVLDEGPEGLSGPGSAVARLWPAGGTAVCCPAPAQRQARLCLGHRLSCAGLRPDVSPGPSHRPTDPTRKGQLLRVSLPLPVRTPAMDEDPLARA